MYPSGYNVIFAVRLHTSQKGDTFLANKKATNNEYNLECLTLVVAQL